jgi:hypothetical protein
VGVDVAPDGGDGGRVGQDGFDHAHGRAPCMQRARAPAREWGGLGNRKKPV